MKKSVFKIESVGMYELYDGQEKLRFETLEDAIITYEESHAAKKFMTKDIYFAEYVYDGLDLVEVIEHDVYGWLMRHREWWAVHNAIMASFKGVQDNDREDA